MLKAPKVGLNVMKTVA